MEAGHSVLDVAAACSGSMATHPRPQELLLGAARCARTGANAVQHLGSWPDGQRRRAPLPTVFTASSAKACAMSRCTRDLAQTLDQAAQPRRRHWQAVLHSDRSVIGTSVRLSSLRRRHLISSNNSRFVILDGWPWWRQRAEPRGCSRAEPAGRLSASDSSTRGSMDIPSFWRETFVDVSARKSGSMHRASNWRSLRLTPQALPASTREARRAGATTARPKDDQSASCSLIRRRRRNCC